MAEKSTPADRGFRTLHRPDLVSGAADEASVTTRALKLIVMAVVIAGLYFGQAIFVPFALAALMSFVLDPLTAVLRRWRFPRVAAVAVVMIVVTAALVGSGIFAGRQIIQLGTDLPTYQDTIERKLRGVKHAVTRHETLGQASRVIDAVKDELGAASKVLEPNDPARKRTPLRVELAEAAGSPVQSLTRMFGPVVGPLTTAGLVLVFVIFILLERNDLRDRFLRVIGGDLFRTTEALDEAAQRVSRYLTMQVLINLGYGLAMGIGLWLIDVPGASLWGFLAMVLRFVPYLGPVAASAFPLLLAFAVDPGWSMLLWTLALIAVLELVINNFIEPWLYGSSTGIAPVAIILSAAFWTLLWGPIGLILATPLTVCLVVMGRHLPHLGFLDIMLGNEPVFDLPTRLYQRLISGNVEEAIELANDEVAAASVRDFHSQIALPALRMTLQQARGTLGARHRHRFYSGIRTLMQDLGGDLPAAPAGGAAPVLCVGARGEADALASEMLQQSLLATDVQAGVVPPSAVSAGSFDAAALRGARVICLCVLNSDPRMHVRYLCRQLRRLDASLRIVVLCPNLPAGVENAALAEEVGADLVVAQLAEACLETVSLLAGLAPPAPPPGDAPGAGPTDCLPMLRSTISATARRVADVFETARVLVCLREGQGIVWRETHEGVECRGWPEAAVPAFFVAAGKTCVVDDVAVHVTLCANECLRAERLRFCAGTPLRDRAGNIVGVLCIMDAVARTFSVTDGELLEELAADMMQALQKMPQDEQEMSSAFKALCEAPECAPVRLDAAPGVA